MLAESKSTSAFPEELSAPRTSSGADRFGVIASVLCAIHCAATPPLLLLLPTFGKVWAHPATHWIMAAVVIPIAALMVARGFRRHRRKWVVAAGVAGILFILMGASAPYFETPTPKGPAPEMALALADTEAVDSACSEACAETCDSASSEEEACAEAADEPEETIAAMESDACVDACCPSLVTQADGSKRLHIPAASVLTTLGGLFLIITHVGNLCCCPACGRKDEQG